MRKPEPGSVTAPPLSPLKSPREFGWRLVSGLGAEARGSADSAHYSSPQKPEAGGLLAYLPSTQKPTVPRSDPKVYEKMALAKS